jgi:hypothetical protein
MYKIKNLNLVFVADFGLFLRALNLLNCSQTYFLTRYDPFGAVNWNLVTDRFDPRLSCIVVYVFV